MLGLPIGILIKVLHIYLEVADFALNRLAGNGVSVTTFDAVLLAIV
jgi:hypothetical protein